MTEEDKEFERMLGVARLGLIRRGRMAPETPEERKEWFKHNGRPYKGQQDIIL